MKKSSSSLQIKHLAFAGVCLALCMLLPFLTGQLPKIGSMLLPMHIPVLLCGLICPMPYAAAVGAIAPILRSAIFGMPPLMPTALCMAFELAAYGAVAAFLIKVLTKNPASVYISLIAAMLIGRVVWGFCASVIFPIAGVNFSLGIFMISAFLQAWPGIIVQLIIIPPIAMALRRTKTTAV